MKQHVMVGMSGGVDSSVSAWLLQQQGYQVSGLFMKNWEEDDTAEYCSASIDLADAQAVADQLKIPLHTVNFATEYWDNVFAYFLQEYQAGRTPNPDIMCNREIKFKAFLELALDLGADCIATGHYAQCRRLDDGNYQMHKGLDNQKDQTYFLYTLQQDQLAKSLFPLGQLEKSLVRKIAQEQNFQTAQKKDSTGICFIGERKFRDFLARFLPAQPGEIISVAGEKLGQHQGLMYYTLGQRQGLGIGGRQSTTNAPWFVVEKVLDTNQLIVAQGHQNPYLLKQGVTATQLYWVAGHPPRRSFRCLAKTRYRQQEESCQVTVDDNGDVQVYFLQPQRAPTPGQSIVFYTDDICLGGGVIEKTQTNGLQDTD